MLVLDDRPCTNLFWLTIRSVYSIEKMIVNQIDEKVLGVSSIPTRFLTSAEMLPVKLLCDKSSI